MSFRDGNIFFYKEIMQLQKKEKTLIVSAFLLKIITLTYVW